MRKSLGSKFFRDLSFDSLVAAEEKISEYSKLGSDIDVSELMNLKMLCLRSGAKDPQFGSDNTLQMANQIISELSESDIALHFGVPNCEGFPQKKFVDC